MAKKCPPGKYYCFTDKKCKKIPRGYRIGSRGYLARDNRSDSGNENGNGNGNGNGSSNGNGNGGNGGGNGNGGSGGNGGGNGSGGGGVGESIIYEKSNPRIPRKKGQPAKSKKHSDLYTDEDPKGTIHGLGFKDVAKAKASVSKIRNSSRSHAHKIQAAVAMEQRAREMGKTSEAAVYRKYINSMKKKTKKMNESVIQLEIPKNDSEFKLGLMFRETLDYNTGMIFKFEQSDRHSFHMKNTSIPLDIAFVKEDGTIDSIKKLNPHDPDPVYPDGKVMYAIETNRDWFANNNIEVGDVVERTMTSSEKRKDTMLKKKYDDSDMKKNMQKQYGKEEGKNIYFATIRKQAMNKEEYISELGKVTLGRYIKAANIDSNVRAQRTMRSRASRDEITRETRKIGKRAQGIGRAVNRLVGKPPDNVTPLNPPPSKRLGIVRNKDGKGGNIIPMDPFREETDKYNVNEEGLRAWFGKSSGTTKSGRKVKGWVQVGGKYDGKPCARQPGQKSTPKCVSSSKRRSMSDKERDSAARRKRAADPNQPQKSGAAKPTNVSTDPKRKMKEEYVTEILGAKLLMKGAQRVGASTRFDALKRTRVKEIEKRKLAKQKRIEGGSGEKMRGTADRDLKKLADPVPRGGKPAEGQSRLTSIARGRVGKVSGKKIGSKLKKGFEDEASRQRAQNKVRQKRGLPTLGGITRNIALAASPGLAIAGLKKATETEKPSLPKGLSRKEIKKKYGGVDTVRNPAQINKTGAFAEETMKKKMAKVKLNPEKKIGVKVTDIGPGGKEYVRKDTMKETKELPKNVKGIAKELDKAVAMHTSQAKRLRKAGISEAKDKKGKGSGSKDACYHKVKSRYSVWPSAYASGALVKCRKVGAANWGNSTKKEGFSPMQVSALEAAGMIEIKEGQKCWKGYEKKGTKMMFGKRYNNCVKKKATKEEVEHIDEKMINITPRFAAARNEVRKRAIKSLAKDAAKPVGIAAAGAAGLGAAKMVTDKMRNEGVEFLKREKEKKKSKSEYLKQRDAGKLAKRKMAKKDQEKVNFLEPEETNESKTRLVKNGHTYKVVLTWRGKTYMVQMFVPSVSRPTRQEIEKEVQKLYPDARVMSFLPRDLEPGEPTVMMGEDVKRDEYGDPIGGPKISKKQLKKNLASNEKDEKITRSEEFVSEDDMKGMSVSSGHKRPTKSGAGMTAKGVAAYRRRNPGSKLKTAVTGKVKKGSKAAKRRKSYCARSAGQMKKFPKAAKDPNSRLRQARRRWKC